MWHREVLTVLANVVGDTWRGQKVTINATGTVQDHGVVGVTLSSYQPQKFRNMTMPVECLLHNALKVRSLELASKSVATTGDGARKSIRFI